MNAIHAITIFSRIALVTVLSVAGLPRVYAQDNKVTPEDPYEQLVSRADLRYSSPVIKSEEGMPVGNGTMGSLVWTTPTALKFQINRVDVFSANASTNNFYQRHTDYCNGVGFVDIDFSVDSKEIFVEPDFRHQLTCYDGQVTTEGRKVTSKVVAWMEDDVMAIEVEDKRENPLPLTIHLRPLRFPLTRKGNHDAKSVLSTVGDKIVLKQEFTEDQYYCGSSLMVGISGVNGKVIQANDTDVTIVVPANSGRFVVFIASAASFDRSEDLIQKAHKKLEHAVALGFDALVQSNELWWRKFWRKSYVHLHSQDGVADMVEKHYTYYLYVMASTSRGKYPPKFNGMLWSTGGDVRKWGSLFWGANQSCLYNALFATNHLELMDPMFDMYSSMLPSCAKAAVCQWGSKGIYIAETVAFDGLGDMPEAIAAEMQSLYLQRKPWTDKSNEFVTYASTKLPFLSRWNWKKDEGWREGKWYSTDKGGGAFGHVTHIFSRGAKIAYQYWMKYEYTQDIEWLRNRAYPVMKGVAEFYRNFPNMRKEADGKYHIFLVNDNESIWGGHNTVEEIASMMGIFSAVIRASEILGVDADLRMVWKEHLKNLSPLPVNVSNGVTVWKRSLPPMVQGNGENLPDPNTLPVWFFDLSNLEADEETKAIANATFDAYFAEGITQHQQVHVLSKLPVAGSLLGRKESTRFLIPNQIKTTEVDVMPNRMDLREGEQTTSIQRLGRAAEALEYALCQSVPAAPGNEAIITLFPAWPEDWDAQFSLLCRGGFLVSSAFKKSKIEFADIRSLHGQECRLRNPWPGTKLAIYRNDKYWKTPSGDLIVFPTRAGERFTLVPASTKLADIKPTLNINGENKE
jgi:hypothetical protein